MMMTTYQFMIMKRTGEFNPAVDENATWNPLELMSNYLERHFNHQLLPAEREAIMDDYPKPNCSAMEVPRLDEEVKKQLKSKGKGPFFGQEKILFDIQEELLDVGLLVGRHD